MNRSDWPHLQQSRTEGRMSSRAPSTLPVPSVSCPAGRPDAPAHAALLGCSTRPSPSEICSPSSSTQGSPSWNVYTNMLYRKSALFVMFNSHIIWNRFYFILFHYNQTNKILYWVFSLRVQCKILLHKNYSIDFSSFISCM